MRFLNLFRKSPTADELKKFEELSKEVALRALSIETLYLSFIDAKKLANEFGLDDGKLAPENHAALQSSLIEAEDNLRKRFTELHKAADTLLLIKKRFNA